MAADSKEVTRLLGEHEVLRAQMKFLADSLERLNAKSMPVKERIWKYRMGLYDFREAMQKHIELDERIFESLLGGPLVEKTMKEHARIRKLVDDAIRLTEKEVAGKLGEEELQQLALNIKKAFGLIQKLIAAHMAKEDELLKPMSKGT